jgi:gliding motility-associated-like protein
MPVLLLPVGAQITASGNASVTGTAYAVENSGGINDNIFIFPGLQGEITATLPGQAGNLNFQWSLYDNLIPGFGEPFRNDQGSLSRITAPQSGGYQVRVTGGNGIDTLLRAWVFVNTVEPSASFGVARYDCQVLDLAATVGIDTFFYYNPYNHDRLALEPVIRWSASPSLQLPQDRLNPRLWNPPPVETEYTLTVDYYSRQASYSIKLDPLTTKAEFEISPVEGEAPLEVTFKSGKSLNALEYQWIFDYRTSTTDEPPAPDDFTAEPLYTYYIPGEYQVALRTINGHCEDLFVGTVPVRVFPSELEVANVFSPDADGYNDVYMVHGVSLREFHGVIYNRNGMKVYEWTDPKEGWDGQAGGKTASPGVYFYTITGVGWDDKEYKFSGPLTLYRNR